MNWKNLSGYFVLACILVLGSTFIVYPAITQVAGIAVAQSSTRWNNVQDAAAGDNLTNGIMAVSFYVWDGTNFDRAPGTTTNGIDVDITRIAANDGVDIGDVTINGPLGGGVEAGAVLVTLASDGTGLVSIDDGGGSITVDGTVTTAPPTVGSAFFAIDRDNIAQSSVNLAFGAFGTSEKVAVETPAANGADICIDWDGGTAACPSANTAGNDRLAPGTTIIIDDMAITSVSVIAASGTQTFTVRAWN